MKAIQAAGLPERAPTVGELVQVRSHRWLVEDVVEPQATGESSIVRLACADDDAQGQSLDVFWDHEVDRQILEDEGWTDLAAKGFDSPQQFAAFLHTSRHRPRCSNRWIEPTLRQEPLRAYAREAEARTLALLDESLGGGGPAPNEVVQRRLLDATPRDIEELLRHLEPRAEESALAATESLRQRGQREAKLLHETLERQRDRVMEEIEKHRREFRQIALDFGDDEGGRQQLEANMRHWERRLGQFGADLEHEPERIRRFYDIKRTRVEPVGLVYLWPETN